MLHLCSSFRLPILRLLPSPLLSPPFPSFLDPQPRVSVGLLQKMAVFDRPFSKIEPRRVATSPRSSRSLLMIVELRVPLQAPPNGYTSRVRNGVWKRVSETSISVVQELCHERHLKLFTWFIWHDWFYWLRFFSFIVCVSSNEFRWHFFKRNNIPFLFNHLSLLFTILTTPFQMLGMRQESFHVKS